MASASKRWAARLASSSRWCAGSLPRRGPFFGVGTALLLDPQGQAALVQLLEDLLQGLRAEVGDREQVVLALLDELADGVDPGPLEAVPRALRQVELLDGQLEVGRRGRRGRHLAELEALGRVREASDQPDEAAQRLARRRERLTRGD